MSLEAYTFREEISKLDEHRNKLAESESKLRNFTLSDKILDEPDTFLNLLGEFSAHVVALIRVMQSIRPEIPLVVSEEKEQTVGRQFQLPILETSITLEKAVIIIVGLAVLSVAVTNGLLPAFALVGAVIFLFCVVFSPQLKSLIKALTAEQPEKPQAKPLEAWVQDRLTFIRKRYTAAYLFVKVQNQTSKDLPHYVELGIDEILYNRKKLSKLTLGADILGVISEVVEECDRNLWERKSLLISAMSLTRQATATVRGATAP